MTVLTCNQRKEINWIYLDGNLHFIPLARIFEESAKAALLDWLERREGTPAIRKEGRALSYCNQTTPEAYFPMIMTIIIIMIIKLVLITSQPC
jgi:hypothetical protein